MVVSLFEICIVYLAAYHLLASSRFGSISANTSSTYSARDVMMLTLLHPQVLGELQRT